MPSLARGLASPVAVTACLCAGASLFVGCRPGPRRQAAAIEFSKEQCAGKEPTVVLLHALFGRRGDRLELSNEARGRVAASAAFVRSAA